MSGAGVWMPMYWGDYLGKTMHFSTFQHGCYLLLIAAYWQNGGPISAEPISLARVCRTSCDKLARYGNPVLAKFTCRDGLLVHQRIDIEIKRSSDRSAAGLRANSVRWSDRTPSHNHTHKERKKEDTTRKRVSPLNGHAQEFDLAYAAYPRHTARGEAEKAFGPALEEAGFDKLMAGVVAYATSVRGKDPQYTAHFATWLRAKRWLDEPSNVLPLKSQAML